MTDVGKREQETGCWFSGCHRDRRSSLHFRLFQTYTFDLGETPIREDLDSTRVCLWTTSRSDWTGPSADWSEDADSAVRVRDPNARDHCTVPNRCVRLSGRNFAISCQFVVPTTKVNEQEKKKDESRALFRGGADCAHFWAKFDQNRVVGAQAWTTTFFFSPRLGDVTVDGLGNGTTGAGIETVEPIDFWPRDWQPVRENVTRLRTYLRTIPSSLTVHFFNLVV